MVTELASPASPKNVTQSESWLGFFSCSLNCGSITLPSLVQPTRCLSLNNVLKCVFAPQIRVRTRAAHSHLVLVVIFLILLVCRVFLLNCPTCASPIYFWKDTSGLKTNQIRSDYFQSSVQADCSCYTVSYTQTWIDSHQTRSYLFKLQDFLSQCHVSLCWLPHVINTELTNETTVQL